MATYTENYNLKMPSGQDAPDVEDFNTNAEIIDTVLKAHSDNTADEYSPDETYTAGRLVINNNALWKAKQDIDVAEAWTPEHWDPTTLAAELSSLNSRGALTALYSTPKAITNPAEQVALSGSIGNFRRLIFLFGYTHTANAATPIEIPVELFKSGYTVTYSFTNAARNCWGQAAYINDNTVSLIGAENQYTPYLLAVYGVS